MICDGVFQIIERRFQHQSTRSDALVRQVLDKFTGHSSAHRVAPDDHIRPPALLSDPLVNCPCIIYNSLLCRGAFWISVSPIVEADDVIIAFGEKIVHFDAVVEGAVEWVAVGVEDYSGSFEIWNLDGILKISLQYLTKKLTCTPNPSASPQNLLLPDACPPSAISGSNCAVKCAKHPIFRLFPSDETIFRWNSRCSTTDHCNLCSADDLDDKIRR